MIKEFKQYLSDNHLYSGPINDSPDDNFISVIKKLEHNLSAAIKKINPSAPNDIAKNIIWHNGLKTTAQDVHLAIKLAQAKMDAFDIDEFQDDPPPEVKFIPSKEDKKIETGNPADSQQIGRTQEVVPEKISQLQRFFEINKLSGNI